MFKSTILFVISFLLAASAWADGTETLGTPSIPIASGSGVRASWIGLDDSQRGNIQIDIPVGATIEQVILYWSGNNQDISELAPTDPIQIAGNPVTVVFIGGNTQYSYDEVTASYRADITNLDIVIDGLNTFSVSGLDSTEEKYGAGVIVIYNDGAAESQVDVRDGNDFAMIDWPSPVDVTEAQTFICGILREWAETWISR